VNIKLLELGEHPVFFLLAAPGYSRKDWIGVVWENIRNKFFESGKIIYCWLYSNWLQTSVGVLSWVFK
jgi:hypothetical protein